MIDSLDLMDFKSFDHESLKVGPFTVIVGANAAGKSNIRDAFRFLHGIGRRYTLPEIVGGKYGAGGQSEWEPIRGATREIVRTGEGLFALVADLKLDARKISYFVGAGSEILGSGGFRIWREELRINGKTIYDWGNDGFEGENASHYSDVESLFRRDQPILTQIHELQPDEVINLIVDTFASMRFLDLVPDRMRQPSFPGQTVLGDSGDNLPTVLKALCADNAYNEVLTQWTSELTPMDVESLEFPEDPAGRVHLVLRERSGRQTSAYSASDGTLRFLAMLAALLGPEPARLYFFEEIDNGIHPSRLNLLIDLIERQTAKGQIQVIATTHSPDMLTIIGDSTFTSTSVVVRLEGTDKAIIRPVAKLANATKLRKSQGLGRLLASGWMETAVIFSEQDEDAGEVSE